MKYFDFEHKDEVFILTMKNKDNTFTFEVLNELDKLIDEVENYQKNTALLITSNYEKTWSTGINLDWYLPLSKEDKEKFKWLMEKVLAKIALLGVPTIASINGNTYAGGAIMPAGMDFRLMRADRGRFCFPEINVKIPFTEILMEIVRGIPSEVLEEMLYTGRALGGEECFKRKVVSRIYSKEELFDKSFELAKDMAKKYRKTYKVTKLFYKRTLLAMYEEHLEKNPNK